MYYSAISLIAAAILIIENQDIFFHFNEAFENPAWKVYKSFLTTVLLYYFADIAWGILESNKHAGLLFVDTSVYFVAMAAGIFLWTQYIVTYLDDRSVFEKLFLYVGRAIAFLATILTFVNILHPVLFTVDENCVYRPLWFRYVILISQIILLLLLSLYAFVSILRREDMSGKRNRYRTLSLFGLIMAVCLLGQLFYPYLPLYAIAYMLGTCLLRAFVIGDEKEEYRQGLAEATRITELKQSITSLLDNMPAMTFSKDVETGVYLACNQSFAEYAHKEKPEGVAGLTDFEIFDQETAAHFVEDDRKALSMDRPHIFFEDVVDAAGSPRQFQTTKLKFYDSNGRMCLLGMSMDVTETEKAKAAYRNAVSTSAVYENIVGALSGDYFNLFYVDLETDDYIEYGSRTRTGQITEDRHGHDFFTECRQNASSFIYEDDRQRFIEAMDKERLMKEVAHNGTFIMQYRLQISGKPYYVNLKAVYADGDKRHLIIGVNSIDAQMRERAATVRMMEERKSYMRLSALVGNLIVLYFVDPKDGHYIEFSSTRNYDDLGIAKEGEEFFSETFKNSIRTVHPDDQERFHAMVTRENILRSIRQNGMFSLDYRLLTGDLPTYVRLRAAMVEEDGKEVLIIGLLDEDAQVRHEQEYAKKLSAARHMATVDALTGVKNKHAYTQWEEKIDSSIEDGTQEPFAVVVCDINNLKEVNDRYGHNEGDVCIRNTSRRICRIFGHSPVFRVGGDEFVVLLMGEDYQNREELLKKVTEIPENDAGAAAGKTVAAGMADYIREEHISLLSVFEGADREMYKRKQYMKSRACG